MWWGHCALWLASVLWVTLFLCLENLPPAIVQPTHVYLAPCSMKTSIFQTRLPWPIAFTNSTYHTRCCVTDHCAFFYQTLTRHLPCGIQWGTGGGFIILSHSNFMPMNQIFFPCIQRIPHSDSYTEYVHSVRGVSEYIIMIRWQEEQVELWFSHFCINLLSPVFQLKFFSHVLNVPPLLLSF